MFGKISRTRTRKVSNGGVKMEKYVCQPCGYVYDPENGDPASGYWKTLEGSAGRLALPDLWYGKRSIRKRMLIRIRRVNLSKKAWT